MEVNKILTPLALLFHSMEKVVAPTVMAPQAAVLPAPSYGGPLQLCTYLCDLQLN